MYVHPESDTQYQEDKNWGIVALLFFFFFLMLLPYNPPNYKVHIVEFRRIIVW